MANQEATTLLSLLDNELAKLDEKKRIKVKEATEIIFEKAHDRIKICFVVQQNKEKVKTETNFKKIFIHGLEKDFFPRLKTIKFSKFHFQEFIFAQLDNTLGITLTIDKTHTNPFSSSTNINNLVFPSLKFDGCIFTDFSIFPQNAVDEIQVFHPIIISNSSFINDISLYRLIFKEKIQIIGTTSQRKFILKGVFFQKIFEISNSDFKEEVEIESSNFEKQFIFQNLQFEKKFAVIDTTFEADIEVSSTIFKNGFIISNRIFKGQVDLRGSEFLGEFNICDFDIREKTIFNERFLLTKCKFKEKFEIKNAIFHGGFALGWNTQNEKTVLQQKVIFENVEFNGYFSAKECLFEKEVSFMDINFKEKPKFKGAKFKGNTEFKNIRFEKEFEILKDTFAEDKLIFEKIKFNLFKCDNKEFFKTKELEFKDCEFQQIHEFKNLEFKKISFNTCRFNDNVYFNNSTFKGYADFHESQFEKVAGFYGVSFEEVPNFSACVFKEPSAVNLIAVNMDEINFDAIEVYIDECCRMDKTFNDKKRAYNNDDKKEKQLELEFKIKYAQNAKDSFRALKDALIRQNNFLEASNFHKFELYAKEIELKYKSKKDHEEVLEQDSKKKKKELLERIENKVENKIGTRVFDFSLLVQYLLLIFYRQSSDHHTSLTRILNFSAGMVAVFGLTLFCHFCFVFNSVKSFDLEYYDFLILSSVIILLAWLRLKIFILFFIIIFSVMLFIGYYFFDSNIILSVVLYFLFLTIFMLFFSCKYKFIRFLSVMFAYTGFIAVFLFALNIITPFVSVFKDDNATLVTKHFTPLKFSCNNENKEISNGKSAEEINKPCIIEEKEDIAEKVKCLNQDGWGLKFFKIMATIYSIIMLLCIFSIQKTARKNSIVPS